MKAKHLIRGEQAERLACRHLQAEGLRLLERNYRTKQGEIDLVMQDGNSLVFVEVRYRKSDNFGSAAESITAAKRAKLIAAANHYLLRQTDRPSRFDVVAISGDQPPGVEWIRNAFDAF
ncbi:YraN family protein [Candidatus Endoriftia persephone]|jgi:putative endonuclease|uniref:UPF0102 protein TevJSym_aj00450 n=3 Tax=Gammaproteobacteria TaxID=1236 RepID=G2FEU8_9GAMM|nr:YraN family protein [Candidatus Endoriftia persephone]EGV49895.1 putative endonuclease [endosymbiont of Riftia pachyptila (vent Ph05)]EGW54680.1 putative endonuclease distantly [endosymbiont of Tevnia jerichonana (vent Tica)]USF88439.1 YraN family protein [Candidatus Endoriftia persephone]